MGGGANRTKQALLPRGYLLHCPAHFHNISHSRDFRFHPKFAAVAMIRGTEHTTIEWTGELTTDGKDPSRRFLQFLSDVASKAVAVGVCVPNEGEREIRSHRSSATAYIEFGTNTQRNRRSQTCCLSVVRQTCRVEPDKTRPEPMAML